MHRKNMPPDVGIMLNVAFNSWNNEIQEAPSAGAANNGAQMRPAQGASPAKPTNGDGVGKKASNPTKTSPTTPKRSPPDSRVPPVQRGDHFYARPRGQVIHAPPYEDPGSPNPFLEWSPPGQSRETHRKATIVTMTGFYVGETKAGETAALSGGEATVWAVLHHGHLVFVPRSGDTHPMIGVWEGKPIPKTDDDFETCKFDDIKLGVHLRGIPAKSLYNLCMSILLQPIDRNGFLLKYN